LFFARATWLSFLKKSFTTVSAIGTFSAFQDPVAQTKGINATRKVSSYPLTACRNCRHPPRGTKVHRRPANRFRIRRHEPPRFRQFRTETAGAKPCAFSYYIPVFRLQIDWPAFPSRFQLRLRPGSLRKRARVQFGIALHGNKPDACFQQESPTEVQRHISGDPRHHCFQCPAWYSFYFCGTSLPL
jgi:hypothetical protein